MSEWVSVLSAVIALMSAGFAAGQAWSANRALKQNRLNRLFDAFNLSSQLAFSDAEVVYAVHGLSRSIPEEEVRNLVYFSVLLDAYKAFWEDKYKGKFSKASRELKANPTYLNKLLRHPDNRRRWQILRPLGYGDLDRDFVHAIDLLLDHEGGG
jgi:hypothetical protein